MRSRQDGGVQTGPSRKGRPRSMSQARRILGVRLSAAFGSSAGSHGA